MKRIFTIIFLIFALNAASSAQTSSPGENRYQACIAMVSEDAGAAFEQALAWESEGGGPAARHCGALALIAQGVEEEGAYRLETLAQDPGSGGGAMRADLLAQAASAWILAGNPARAEKVLTTALILTRLNPDLYLARGEARALQDNVDKAMTDFSDAIKLNPLDPQAYVFRAVLLRKQGKSRAASTDLAAALDLAPQHLSALLERGRLHEENGNTQAARADYISVLRWGDDGPDVVAARAALERLDLVVN